MYHSTPRSIESDLGFVHLIEAARQAARHAYCPYSKFPVGAAVEVADGTIYQGGNVENASYGLSICAERSAIFAAIGGGWQSIRKIAVSCLKGDPGNPHTLMPCGACRQVMAEFGSPELVVMVDGVGVVSLADLLPNAFGFKESVGEFRPV